MSKHAHIVRREIWQCRYCISATTPGENVDGPVQLDSVGLLVFCCINDSLKTITGEWMRNVTLPVVDTLWSTQCTNLVEYPMHKSISNLKFATHRLRG